MLPLPLVPLLMPPTARPPLPTAPQAQQFTTSRRDELIELQRSLLGFEDIALREGLKPSEAEIEVRLLFFPQGGSWHRGLLGPACKCLSSPTACAPAAPLPPPRRASSSRRRRSLGSTARSTTRAGCGSRWALRPGARCLVGAGGTLRQSPQFPSPLPPLPPRAQVFETVQANKVMDWLIARCDVEMLPPQEPWKGASR